MMARFNLDSGPTQILIPQLIQGVGFAFMFVALGTVSLSTISRQQMQNAAGLFNLVRQLGGSLGTAIVITLLDHKTTIVSASLVRYASPYNPTFVRWWQEIQAGFVARGSDVATAHRQALAVLHTFIAQQSAVIAFDYVFFLIGVVFFACLPLVVLMRQGRIGRQGIPSAE
jgi:DHA2 family multidrug resistance protein